MKETRARSKVFAEEEIQQILRSLPQTKSVNEYDRKPNYTDYQGFIKQLHIFPLMKAPRNVGRDDADESSQTTVFLLVTQIT